MANGYVRVALEAAPNAEGGGNALSTAKFFWPATNIEIDPKPTMLDTKDELRGALAELPHKGAAKYAPEGAIDVRSYPDVLGQLLCLLVGTPVTTQGVAGPGVVDPDSVQIPVGVYRHVFAWKTGESPNTGQIDYSPPSGGFGKATGFGIDEATFKPDAQGAWAVAAKLLGLYVDPVSSDPSLTPSYGTAKAFLRGQMALTWLASSAITEDFEWTVKNGLAVEQQFTTSSLFPDSIIYDANMPVLSGSIPKRSFDSDDWAALVAGTTFSAKMKYTHSENVTGSYKHQLWVELPACQYTGGKRDGIKNERRNKASFDWEARWDTATSKFATLTLCNGTASYA